MSWFNTPWGAGARSLGLGLLLAVGCGVQRDATIHPDARLGRVIIYRNGVAYFERQTRAHGSIELTVPGDRVDDFLKSLAVVDIRTGDPLAVSYETHQARRDGVVVMTIVLPPGRRDVRITYVTESPPWKPTYRLHLDEERQGRLQAWAVVDNTTGEAWRQVTVGVGTTSALSFRYDLHSVRTVQRQAIESGQQLAMAPPTGGSPYAVAGEDERVIANLSATAIGTGSSAQYTLQGADATVARDAYSGSAMMRQPPIGSRGDSLSYRESVDKAQKEAQERAKRPPTVEEVAAQLRINGDRIRIQSLALTGETDPVSAEQRGNALRDRLVEHGIERSRIEVASSSTVAETPQDALKVVALETDTPFTQAEDVEPGEALFVADGALDLDAGHSALVTLFDGPTEAHEVYLFDPISPRGSKRHAFRAVRFDNPTDNTLDPGPLTVYAQGRYLGEGMSEPIPARSTAIIPFALDRKVTVNPTSSDRDEIEKIVRVERAIATVQVRRFATTKLELHNRGQTPARVYVRHRVPPNWSLVGAPRGVERLGSDVLIPFVVAQNETEQVVVEVAAPITTSLDLRSGRAIGQLGLFIESGRPTDRLAKSLAELVQAWHARADLEASLKTRAEQLALQRGRLEELRRQLVTLRKVKSAASLSRRLAHQMQEHSDAVDAGVVELSRLKDESLAAQVRLHSVVAQLDLEESSVDHKP